jgi:hypothetical protein
MLKLSHYPNDVQLAFLAVWMKDEHAGDKLLALPPEWRKLMTIKA